MTHPLVSVVMPSFNQARFLRDAIDSVLRQDYPHIELLVMDGGSTDGSAEILESYGDHLAFVSEPDDGQSDAINRGFAQLNGQIFAWLNSDDRYCGGAVARAVQALSEDRSASMVYGEGELINEDGTVSGAFHWTQDFDLWRLARVLDYIMQPAVFMRSAALKEIGGLDVDLHYGMDWDLWIRLACRGRAMRIREVLAQSREYGETKTATGGFDRFRELRRIMARHGARGWPPGAIVYGLDTLRKVWPAIFGASSAEQLEATKDRWLTRFCEPVHRRVSQRIEKALLHDQGVYPDGWVARRGYTAAAWKGEGGVLRLVGEAYPDPRLLPLTVCVEAAGRSRSVRLDRAGEFAIDLELPRPGGDPRVLEVVIHSDRDAVLDADRRISFQLRSVRLAKPGDEAGH